MVSEWFSQLELRDVCLIKVVDTEFTKGPSFYSSSENCMKMKKKNQGGGLMSV